MDIFSLSRNWFNYCFENPEKISPNHTALYFFCIEHCNRLGWKEKFGLPSEMAKEAIGIKNYRTYTKTLTDLIDWGFIILVQKSYNQYSSNIIAIVKNTKATTKALDKALQKHSQKQCNSKATLDIQETILPIHKKQDFDFSFIEIEFSKPFYEWLEYKKERKQGYKTQKSVEKCYYNLKILSDFDPCVAQKMIDTAMGNNWAGFFKIKEQKQSKHEEAGQYVADRLRQAIINSEKVR